jgi:hypothetical protein
MRQKGMDFPPSLRWQYEMSAGKRGMVAYDVLKGKEDFGFLPGRESAI